MSDTQSNETVRREALADRLGQTRRESMHGALIAQPEIGRDWLLSLAQTVLDLGWEDPDAVAAARVDERERIGLALDEAIAATEWNDWPGRTRLVHRLRRTTYQPPATADGASPAASELHLPTHAATAPTTLAQSDAGGRHE